MSTLRRRLLVCSVRAVSLIFDLQDADFCRVIHSGDDRRSAKTSTSTGAAKAIAFEEWLLPGQAAIKAGAFEVIGLIDLEKWAVFFALCLQSLGLLPVCG